MSLGVPWDQSSLPDRMPSETSSQERQDEKSD